MSSSLAAHSVRAKGFAQYNAAHRELQYNDSVQIALNIIVFVLVFVLGAVIASFLNVLVYRIPRKLDFVRGRSFCPNCEHPLSSLDLIPILSYLALKRKCRYCKEPISPRYALVELAGGVLSVLCFVAFMGLDCTAMLIDTRATAPLLTANPVFLGSYAPICAAIAFFAALCILLTVALIDADTMEIPNGLSIALAIVGVLSFFTGPEVALLSRGIGVVAVSVPLFLIAFIIPGAFGGGDVKLMAAAGLLLGWESLLVAFFIGLIIGGGYGIFVLATGRKERREHFAFGPALCIGIGIALFTGQMLLDWYIGLL